MAKWFPPHLKNKRVICLNIPDEFELMLLDSHSPVVQYIGAIHGP
jgi:predicted protein tyrosine phosphatase